MRPGARPGHHAESGRGAAGRGRGPATTRRTVARKSRSELAGEPGRVQAHVGTAAYGPPVDDALLFRVVDALDGVADETGRTVPQVAINWLLQRPTVASVILGARTEAQLRDNLRAVGWRLTPGHVARRDAASAVTPAYPQFAYHRQAGFARRNPVPV